MTHAGAASTLTVPAGTKVVYVIYSAEIVPKTVEPLIAAASQLATMGIEELHLMMSTPGGHVMSGLHLYGVLRAMPYRVVTYNTGAVNSIGNAIFLAGDSRYAAPHSTFMFHGVGFDVKEGARFEEKLLRERLDGLMADQRSIGAVIEARTKLTTEDVGKLFLEAQTKDAAYAASCGIVDEVRDIEVPKGVPVLAFVFQR